MAGASYAIPNFLGGELSQFAQGRFDKPDYHLSLNVCFNAMPSEIGAWSRRPGTQHAGHTRGGAPGREIKFDFEQSNAVTLEFTDGWLRFRNGTALITTNDKQTVSAVSTANPAVVQTAAAHGWSTGNTVIFPAPGPAALLEGRQFTATVIDTTHFSLADALTGATINGSTLGAIASGATAARVQELTTTYVGGVWASVRAVQAETTDILLCATVPPQALTVQTLPSSGVNPVFAINPATFNDGPYLDPFTNGAQVAPSAKSGIISLTLAFPAYSSTTAYAVGSFVASGGVNYVSLKDQNANNTPVSSPTFWAPTAAVAAIGPNGFQGTDVGRLVRLFSEPPAWDINSTYTTGTETVSYNPSGVLGAATYWQNQTVGNHAAAPGTDLINWKIIPQGAAVWTWGKIVSLSSVIDRLLAGSLNFGDMTANGGNNAAFDGVFSQPLATSARKQLSSSGSFPFGTALSMGAFVGKNYSLASPQKIAQATVYPSTDEGFGSAFSTSPLGGTAPLTLAFALNLRGKASAPASGSDGTLLGSWGPTTNTTSAVTILSNDTTTAWPYVWLELIVTGQITDRHGSTGFVMDATIAEISFFSPPTTASGAGAGNGVNVEILGPPLLYTNPVMTWRLGVYSNTTGWPTCGTYHEGRLWLGGALANRFDASVSNGIVGGTVNFAPSDQYGVVASNNAISYTLNSDSVNPIFWMQPDLQGIIIGTQAGEWLAVAPTSGPLSPTNIAARRVTKIGCANIEPRRTEHTSVFVKRYSQKLMEYFADVYSGKFSAPNLADKAQHITRAGIAELAYTEAVAPVIWGRDTLGALFGITYKRDTLTTAQGPTFAAWHRHALGSGRTVESICTGPSTGGNLDTLTMITTDSPTGTRHVEVLTDAMDELSPLTAAWFLDDAVVPTSTLSSGGAVAGAPFGGLTLNGLWHLNGQTVQVFAGGLDCGYRGAGTTGFTDFVVTNGSCFVPYGDGVSAGCGSGLFTAAYVASITPFPIVVGFTYTSQGQLVRPHTQADSGARSGPAFGKLRRHHRYAMQLVNTFGLFVGTTFAKLFPVNFKQANNQSLAPLTTFTGIQQDTIQDDYTYDGMIAWQVARPYPANIIAIGGNIATQDQ